MRTWLHQYVPVLWERYWPTVWCVEARAQTIMRALIKTSPQVRYDKELVGTPDGGHVALHWRENDEGSKQSKETRPTVLILPGLTGSSEESYALHFVQQTCRLGYRAVVFNYRGFGGADLKTARSYSAANTDDLSMVIKH